MTVSLTPLARMQFNQGGIPLAGGKLYTYSAGTTTKLATYTDSTGGTPNTNPVILDANGQCDVWLTDGSAYKFVLSPSTDTDPPTNAYWTKDNISNNIIPFNPTFNNVTVSGTLGVTGATTLSTVNVTGNATFGGTINKVTLTQPATAATLTLANNSTLATVGAFASTFTITGTTTLTFPTSGTLALNNQATDTFGALTDITTNNVSTTAHGFAPKLPNNANVFLNGAGGYTAPNLVTNGYISGFTLSNDGGTPNTILDIAAGYAADSTNAVMITGTAFTKKTGGSWVAGSNANGMGSGITIANSTWYHVFAIINNGSFDVYFDTSATAANKPASTTAFRYIGSFKTSGAAAILAFTQYGQRFLWSVPAADLTSGAATVQTAVTLSTPLGFNTQALTEVLYVPTNTNNTATFYETQATQPAYRLSDTAAAGLPGSGYYRVGYSFMTNTSSQIGYKTLNATDPVSITTNGYINPHVAAVF